MAMAMFGSFYFWMKGVLVCHLTALIRINKTIEKWLFVDFVNSR